jgi:hypothetical protein
MRVIGQWQEDIDHTEIYRTKTFDGILNEAKYHVHMAQINLGKLVHDPALLYPDAREGIRDIKEHAAKLEEALNSIIEAYRER